MANNNNAGTIQWGSDIRYTTLVKTQLQINALSEILDASGPGGNPHWKSLATKLGEKPIYIKKVENMINHTTKSGGSIILENFQHSREATVQNYLRIFQDINCHDAILLIAEWIMAAPADVIPMSHPLRELKFLHLENVALDSQQHSDCLIETSGLPDVSSAALPNHLFWPPNTTLKIYFMEPTQHPDIQEKIMLYIKEWTLFSQIQFQRTDNREASDVRITFTGQGCQSAIGREALKIPKTKHTMCLADLPFQPTEEDLKRTILHEFGHVLGLIHEHQRPDVHIPLDTIKTLAYYQRYYGWPPQQIYNNILNPKHYGHYDLRCKTGFDPLSIMIYHIPTSLLDSSHPQYQQWVSKMPESHPKDLSDADKQIFPEFYKFKPESVNK